MTWINLRANPFFLCIDFSDSQSLKEKIATLADDYHILINNTGGPAGGPITDANTESFEDAFRMHLVNNQLLVQKVIKGMKAANFGRIINIISTSVKAPIPGFRSFQHNTSSSCFLGKNSFY